MQINLLVGEFIDGFRLMHLMQGENTELDTYILLVNSFFFI